MNYLKYLIGCYVDIDEYGNKYWYKYWKIHRDNDQPAIICTDGNKYWYQNDQLHRDNDQPAVICTDGNKYWYQNGEIHRDNDQPAIIYNNGDKDWYQNGKQHRDGDQPAVIYTNGYQAWYKNGEYHRENGPVFNNKYYLHDIKWSEENYQKFIKQMNKYNQYVDGYGWIPRRLTYILRNAILKHQFPKMKQHFQQFLEEEKLID